MRMSAWIYLSVLELSIGATFSFDVYGIRNILTVIALIKL